MQEGLNECQPCLEIYGGGGKCIPAAGNANAIWQGICKQKAADRVEAVKAIKKITYSKPGAKFQSRFSDTTPRISRTAAGEVSEAAVGDFSRTSRRPQLALAQATKDRKTIRNFTCTLFSKNTVYQPTPQVEANRQYQLDAILPIIKRE